MSPTGGDGYREWTGAYVLGALSPSERREFERHLGDCAGCAASVAEFSGLPALLDLLTHDQAVSLGRTVTSETPHQIPRPVEKNTTEAAPKEHRDD
ncbi:zf-HC2 domain-containing protein [Arthrobacter sp. UYCu723]